MSNPYKNSNNLPITCKKNGLYFPSLSCCGSNLINIPLDTGRINYIIDHENLFSSRYRCSPESITGSFSLRDYSGLYDFVINYLHIPSDKIYLSKNEEFYMKNSSTYREDASYQKFIASSDGKKYYLEDIVKNYYQPRNIDAFTYNKYYFDTLYETYRIEDPTPTSVPSGGSGCYSWQIDDLYFAPLRRGNKLYTRWEINHRGQNGYCQPPPIMETYDGEAEYTRYYKRTITEKNDGILIKVTDEIIGGTIYRTIIQGNYTYTTDKYPYWYINGIMISEAYQKNSFSLNNSIAWHGTSEIYSEKGLEFSAYGDWPIGPTYCGTNFSQTTPLGYGYWSNGALPVENGIGYNHDVIFHVGATTEILVFDPVNI